MFTITTVNKDFSLDFEVHYGFVRYLSQCNPEEFWNERGIAGHSSQDFLDFQRKKLEETAKILDEKLLEKDKFQRKIEEVFRVFYGLLEENKDVLNTYIYSNNFFFILGAGRSGGTFMLKQMFEVTGNNLEDYHYPMLHDCMPDGKFDSPKKPQNNGRSLGWRRPEYFYNLLFQIAQFLVYFNDVLNDSVVYAKKVKFYNYLKLVDYYFKESARYIVTVRHPAAIHRSRREHGKSFGVPQQFEDNKRSRLKTLNLWENTYKSIVAEDPPTDLIHPVEYGEPMNDFLRSFYKEFVDKKQTEQIEECAVKERKYSDFWKSNKITSVINEVKEHWSTRGLTFPELKKIR